MLNRKGIRFYIIGVFLGLFFTNNVFCQIRYSSKLFSYQLNSIQTDLSGDYQWKERELEGVSNNGAFSRYNFLEEIVFDGSGYIYHPNLFDYTALLGVNFNQGNYYQDKVEVPGGKQKGVFQRVNFRTTMLKNKPLTLSFNINSNHRRIRKNFYEDMEQDLNKLGLTSRVMVKKIPLNFGWQSEDYSEDYSGRLILRDETRYTFNSQVNDFLNTKVSLNSSYVNTNRSESDLYSHHQKQKTARMQIQYPAKQSGRKFGFNSNFNFNSLEGNISNTILSLSNSAKYDIKKNLHSNFQYNYRNNTSKENNSNLQNFSANINHSLFKSLQSSASFSLNLFNEENYQKADMEIPISIQYNKKLKKGKLFLDWGYQPSTNSISGESSVASQGFLIESFKNGPIYIEIDSIDKESIIVSSDDELISYENPGDFTIFEEESFLVITRTFGSSIGETDNIRISYIYYGEATGSQKYSIWNYGISYKIVDFYDLSVGYKGYSDHVTESHNYNWGAHDEKEVDQFFVKFYLSPVTAELNHEVSNSLIIPFSATNFNIYSIFGTHISQYLLINANLSTRHYDLTGFEQNQYQSTIEYFRRITAYLKSSVNWTYRSMKGDVTDLQESKLTIKANYDVRKIQVSAEYEQKIKYYYEERDIDWRFIVKVSIIAL